MCSCSYPSQLDISATFFTFSFSPYAPCVPCAPCVLGHHEPFSCVSYLGSINRYHFTSTVLPVDHNITTVECVHWASYILVSTPLHCRQQPLLTLTYLVSLSPMVSWSLSTTSAGVTFFRDLHNVEFRKRTSENKRSQYRNKKRREEVLF